MGLVSAAFTPDYTGWDISMKYDALHLLLSCGRPGSRSTRQSEVKWYVQRKTRH